MALGRSPYWLALGAALFAVSCSGSGGDLADPAEAATPTTAPASTAPPTTAQPPATEVVDERPFVSTIDVIEGDVAERVVGVSWREGCPVALADLRYLTVSYVDFSGQAQVGELIVAADVADDIVSIFSVLFAERFPIERMALVDDYAADDLTSMVANNTSAFNCRFVDGTEQWSEHAFGRAIDINPLINPWVRAGSVSPVEGAPYADRTVAHVGGIYDGSVIVTAFEDAGWTWGGSWDSSQDYQHFSADGS